MAYTFLAANFVLADGPSAEINVAVNAENVTVNITVSGMEATDIDHIDVLYYEVQDNGDLTQVNSGTIKPPREGGLKFVDVAGGDNRKKFKSGKKYMVMVNIY